ncbi:MAG: hypothetical protein M1829_004258 [Trizodia sp. TS-e1964]|nr:MAG: hypothetical protein M1829_004258 [Trizodia sp. TS-e1964]
MADSTKPARATVVQILPPISALKPSVGSVRLHALCIFFALGSLLWGYNIGILATIYVSPGFINELNKPDASKQGLITAIYYLGSWISYVFLASPASDFLGRRWACFVGAIIICTGGSLQAGATGNRAFSMMIVGRIVAGVGVAIVSTSVPMYQSEISPAKIRGRFVVMNHIGLVAGLAVAFWVGYGMSFWTTGNGFNLSWRLSILAEFIPAVLLCAGLPFTPPSPRWLIEKGRFEEARKSMQWIRGVDDTNNADVLEELDDIREAMEIHRSSGMLSWRVLFTNKDLFARMWRVALLHFMAQMCGATAMKYYLPTNFIALGLGKQMSLLAGGIESTLKIGCTIIEMFLVDRFGRKSTLIVGCAIMVVALLINGVLPQIYPNNLNRPSDYACIVFIFVFTFGYSIGFGPNAWVYGAEIFPTHLRAKGLCLAASGGAVGSIVVAQIWPVAFQNIGSKTYFIFMATNFASMIILIIFYPETKGKTLEEMDNLFEKNKDDAEQGDGIARSTSVASPVAQEAVAVNRKR